jgi:MFS transporter, ACS family, tartrate transporter
MVFQQFLTGVVIRCTGLSSPIPDPADRIRESERLRRRVARRILPFVFLLYVIGYLDRTNVSFVRFPMSEELGFSEAVYGVGSGVFFLGYFLLQIPGALIVERWGARRWVGSILITWGAVTALFAFVHTPGQFYAGRFLLGVAQAGFFPGVVVYLTQWFRHSDRSRAMAGFMVAAPVSLAIGGPLSALILQIQWLQLSSWRWVFILQGLPAVLFGAVTFWYLTDSPRVAHWLHTSERQGIQEALDLETQQRTSSGAWWQALRDPNVIVLCLAYGLINIAGYGYIFWLPSTVRTTLNLTAGAADAASCLPWAMAVVVMLFAGHSSDRTGRPKLHACIPLLCGGLFFALSTVPGQPAWLVFAWVCFTGATGSFGWMPGFWTLPTSISAGSARAASVGLINSVGNLGGFVGSAVIGYLRTRFDPNHALVLIVSLSWLTAALLTSLVKSPAKAAHVDARSGKG